MSTAEQPTPAGTLTRQRAMSRHYHAVVWATALCGFAFAIVTSRPLPFGEVLAVTLFTLAANIADLAGIRIQPGMRVSTAHFAAPFALVVAGPLAGIVAAIGSLAGRAVFNREDWRGFDVALNMLAVSSAAIIWVQGRELAGGSTPWLVVLVTVVLVSFSVARSLIAYGWAVQSRSQGMRIPDVTFRVGLLMVAASVLLAPALATFLLLGGGPLAGGALLMPFVASHFLVRQYGRERLLNTEVEASHLSLTTALINALDARDPYSAGHSVAVAVYARDLARELGMSDAQAERLYLAGLLHDIGKIALRDDVLRKPGALTDGEFEEIRVHPEIGARILSPSSHLADIIPAVRHHHERLDGTGYPAQLDEGSIPLAARIVGVVDAYNAMTSTRPYRTAMKPMVALRILAENQGRQHDPVLVAAFTELLERRGMSYARARGAEFESAAPNVSDLVVEAEQRSSRAARIFGQFAA